MLFFWIKQPSSKFYLTNRQEKATSVDMTSCLKKLSTTNIKDLLVLKQYVFKQNWLQNTKRFIKIRYFKTLYWVFDKIAIDYFFNHCFYTLNTAQKSVHKNYQSNLHFEHIFVGSKVRTWEENCCIKSWGWFFFEFIKRGRLSK